MKLLNILCIALLTAGVAFAGMYDPDYRGDENSVHAVFDVPPFVLPPWVPQDPVIFETGPSSYPLAPINPSVFSVDQDTTEITLPNFIDELPMKKMRIQMEFSEPVALLNIQVEVIGYDNAFFGPPELVPGMIGGRTPLPPFIPELNHYFDIEMYPNPDYEEITILTPQGTLLWVEIDTVSIPEPATLGLLGLISGCIYFTRRFFIV